MQKWSFNQSFTRQHSVTRADAEMYTETAAGNIPVVLIFEMCVNEHVPFEKIKDSHKFLLSGEMWSCCTEADFTQTHTDSNAEFVTTVTL